MLRETSLKAMVRKNGMFRRRTLGTHYFLFLDGVSDSPCTESSALCAVSAIMVRTLDTYTVYDEWPQDGRPHAYNVVSAARFCDCYGRRPARWDTMVMRPHGYTRTILRRAFTLVGIPGTFVMRRE